LSYENGDLRYIRLGDREIIRRVYVAIRDHNWGTARNVLSNVKLNVADDHFHIQFQVDNHLDAVDFGWVGEITGDRHGTITFNFDGEARSTFWRNRIGFCVLHPMRECAGAKCLVEHQDGGVQSTTFPEYIAPQWIKDGRPAAHGDFYALSAITHQVLPDLWAELRFEGEEFELEDQRNWIDASYKTYCTSLSRPFPVEITQGTRLHQRVSLRLQGLIPTPSTLRLTSAAPSNAPPPVAVSLVPGATVHALPALGVGVASHGGALTDQEAARLRGLRLSHLRVELRLSDPGWQIALQAAVTQARRIGAALEVVAVISDAADAELRAMMAALAREDAPTSACLIWHVSEMVAADRWLSIARRQVRGYDARLSLGAGSKANFAELNRAWPAADLIDFVSVAANPQVHATDNASLVETGAAFAPLVATARLARPDTPLAISALTLKPQFNAVATGPVSAPPPGELPPQVDPRQMSLLCAGWVVSCLKHLSEAGGVRYVSLFETTGWRGVMASDAGSPLPQKFPSLPGGVFPVYHVLADLGEMQGGRVIPVQSSAPLRVEAWLTERGGQHRWLLANLTPAPQEVSVPTNGERVLVRMLDVATFSQAVTSPEAFRERSAPQGDAYGATSMVRLPPYAVACLDVM
jgi:hypothetical protein